MSLVKELKGVKAFLFDFDGVLVDSYTSMPIIYREIGEKLLNLPNNQLDSFVQEMLHGEELHDLGLLGKRREWWPDIIRKFANGRTDIELDKIEEFFWEKRIETSKVIEGVENTLKYLRGNFYISIMCSRDDQMNHKMKRIKKSGLDKYFNDFYIVGENISTRIEAINKVIKTKNLEAEEIAVFDDKVPPLYEIKNLDVKKVKVDFEGPLKLAWNLPVKVTLRVKKIVEIIEENGTSYKLKNSN